MPVTTQTRPEPLTDTDAWGLVFASDHWACGGWTIDGYDSTPVCACGTELRSDGGTAA